MIVRTAGARLLSVVARETPGVLLLCVLTGLWTVIHEDIAFDDEAAYLSTGLSTAQPGSFSSGPLYGQIYRAVDVVAGDPVSTYILGRAFVACVFVLGVWLATRLIARARVAWTIAAVAAAIPVSHVWPGVATPVAALMVTALALLIRWPRLSTLTLVSVMTWIAAGMRPEFVWMAAAVTVWAVVALLRQAATRHRHDERGVATALALATAALGFPLVLVARYGAPWGGASRSWDAFSQHFALRHALPGENPWYDHAAITKRAFGPASSVLEALGANPSAFWKHVSTNLTTTPIAVVDFIAGVRPRIASPESVAQVLVLVALAAVVWSIARAVVQSRKLMPSTDDSRHLEWRWALAFGALWSATTLISVVVISPREHYLVGVVAVLLVGAGWVIDRYAGFDFREFVLPISTVVLVALLSVLALADTVNTVAPSKPEASTARALQAFPKPLKYLSGLWGLHVYVPGLQPVPAEAVANATSFEEFLFNSDVQAVLVNPTLSEGAWATLPGFGDFVRDPGSFGFRPSGPGSELWLRDDLSGGTASP